jgi:hypothetical protein
MLVISLKRRRIEKSAKREATLIWSRGKKMYWKKKKGTYMEFPT